MEDTAEEATKNQKPQWKRGGSQCDHHEARSNQWDEGLTTGCTSIGGIQVRHKARHQVRPQVRKGTYLRNSRWENTWGPRQQDQMQVILEDNGGHECSKRQR